MSYQPSIAPLSGYDKEWLQRELHAIANELRNPVALEAYNSAATVLGAGGVTITFGTIKNQDPGFDITSGEIEINVDGEFEFTFEVMAEITSGIRYSAVWHIEEYVSSWTAISGTKTGTTHQTSAEEAGASITFTHKVYKGRKYRLIGTGNAGLSTVAEGCRVIVRRI